MTQDTLNKDVIDQIDKNIERQEAAKIEALLADSKKAMDEMNAKFESQKSEFEKQLQARDDSIKTIKADFDKQLENISLRKSASNNSQEAAKPAVKKPYKDLTPAEKDEVDKQWLASQKIRF